MSDYREKWWAKQKRCPSVSPDGLRCGMEEGHEGNHSALIETGAPWLGKTDWDDQQKENQTVTSTNEPAPYTTWRHVATDSLYVVLGVALCGTNGEREHRERSVIYFSLNHQELCYREVSEFMDGRFVQEVTHA